MSEAKNKRIKKRQLGQFLTPKELANSILSEYKFSINDKILEPSFGDGSFIFAIIEKLIPLYGNISNKEKIDNIFANNIFGVELDKKLYNKFFTDLQDKYGYIPQKHNLFNKDFFTYDPKIKFNYIIGNPPFGGTINYKYQDKLDKKLGTRFGKKIKKETYSFFLVKSVDLLGENGKLIFICSDSFLTINTMSGLRNFLMKSGSIKISNLSNFSEETDYGMVIIDFMNNKTINYINLQNEIIDYKDIFTTPNLSWKINKRYIKYFSDLTVGDFLLCSSGMTVGKNEFFIRKINDNFTINEPFIFSFFNEPITLDNELKRARLNKLSESKTSQISQMEDNGETKRNVRITKRKSPKIIKLPHKDYTFYNKANSNMFYAKPTHVIYWKNDGDAVYTYKKNGNWYLHGVGGKSFFKKEGLTWNLIAKKMFVKYLPKGYILDSGAPIGILKDGQPKNELFFLIGWLSTNLCNSILKNVINHTKNIQSKDVERLPYPFWVNSNDKKNIIQCIKQIIIDIKNDKSIDKKYVDKINKLFNL